MSMNKTGNMQKFHYGLTSKQVEERKQSGLVNYEVKPKFKTKKQILISNVFTYFNILNFLLALCVLCVGSIKNVFFIGVVVCNAVIGVIQEIKAMNTIKKLSIVSQPKVTVIRDDKKQVIDVYDLVLDDDMILESGCQIAADAIVKNGEVEVDESLITGESDLILKKHGDKLISGSVVVSGNCVAQVENVGKNTYVSQILIDAGQYKDTRNKSEIMSYINKLVKIVSIVIGPVGVLRFYKEYFILNNNLQNSVIFTVASVIGMIPEGITLLTSITLMIGVIKLSKLKVLTQDLFSLETLAKVDVLCLDKTGTLTRGDIEVNEVILVDETYQRGDIENFIGHFCKCTDDKGATIDGLKKFFSNKLRDVELWKVESRVPFSSARKWSGVNFFNGFNVVVGAPEILLKDAIKDYDVVQSYVEQGKRLLAIGLSNEKLILDKVPNMKLLAFVVMSDKIRDNAIQTIDFFKKQGVEIKIISGDNATSVARIAKMVNLNGSDKYVDASLLADKDAIIDGIAKYNVFGRTTPRQKKEIINAYQKSGYTVGMVGDGVNDILALKDADCSIAMANGSDAAKQISKFVLLDCDFKHVPTMLNEGRRVINNIMRAASMFLIKNIYSFALSIILLFFAQSYPFMPVQLTLIGALTIGMPSFCLVLEENSVPIKSNFFKRVFYNAMPPALAIIVNIFFINIINNYLACFSQIEISTIAVVLTGFCNLMELTKISKPLNFKHKFIILFFLLAFILSVIFLKDVLFLCSFNFKMVMIIMMLTFYSYWQINLCFKDYKSD